MVEHTKGATRLGLVAMALSSLAAPVLIQNAQGAAASNMGGSSAVAPQTGSLNTIILGADGRSHNQTIILGNDGKPQNNRFILGSDGKYHQNTAIIVQGAQPATKPDAPDQNKIAPRGPGSQGTSLNGTVANGVERSVTGAHVESIELPPSTK